LSRGLQLLWPFTFGRLLTSVSAPPRSLAYDFLPVNPWSSSQGTIGRNSKIRRSRAPKKVLEHPQLCLRNHSFDDHLCLNSFDVLELARKPLHDFRIWQTLVPHVEHLQIGAGRALRGVKILAYEIWVPRDHVVC